MYKFERTQLINAGIKEVWEFVSRPENLRIITPPEMQFRLKDDLNGVKMYEGMIINYKLKPLLGIPAGWTTEISHIKEPHFFIDTQVSGPYNFWHHQHHLEEVENGVLMRDIIHYKPPFGFLGKIANTIIIKSQLESIFSYRKTVLERIFKK